MQKLNQYQVFQLLCKLTGKWGVQIFPNYNQDDEFIPWQEYQQAVPYLDYDEDLQLIMDGFGIILCDTETEMNKIYRNTIGDDGPSIYGTNKYDGRCRVYACTCDPNGQILNENT